MKHFCNKIKHICKLKQGTKMIFESLANLFSYEFIRNAFFAGIFISLGFSILSPILLIKGCTLLGHGLSDVGFATFSIASILSLSPIFVSMPLMMIVSFLIICFSHNRKYNASSLIAVFSTAALAIGITVASLNKGINSTIYSYMFGSIFSVSKKDLILSIVVNSIAVLIFILFYNKFFLISIDEDFAKSRGFKVIFYKLLISLLIASVTVLGIKLVGTLLVSSFMLFPALISKKMASSFKSLVLFSFVFSVLSFTSGMLTSFIFNIPTGASIVFVNVVLAFILSIWKLIRQNGNTKIS